MVTIGLGPEFCGGAVSVVIARRRERDAGGGRLAQLFYEVLLDLSEQTVDIV